MLSARDTLLKRCFENTSNYQMNKHECFILQSIDPFILANVSCLALAKIKALKDNASLPELSLLSFIFI